MPAGHGSHRIMESGEAAGVLFFLAAAVAVAAAVFTGAVDFTYLVAGTAKRLAFPSSLSRSFLPACVVLIEAVSLAFVFHVGSGGGGSPSSSSGDEWAAWREVWAQVRSREVAPALQAAVWACMVMSVMLVVEATYHSAVSLGVKLLGWKPERRFKWEPLAATASDEEGKGDTSAYPMVMVQIPMYNELEVYKLSIGAAYELKWPKERLIVQVLDDSTDPFIKFG